MYSFQPVGECITYKYLICFCLVTSYWCAQGRMWWFDVLGFLAGVPPAPRVDLHVGDHPSRSGHVPLTVTWHLPKDTDMAQVPVSSVHLFLVRGPLVYSVTPPDATHSFSADTVRHYNDVIMSSIASQIPSWLFAQLFVQAQIKENIEAPRHWPLWGEFTGDRWIPHTKG